MAAFHPTDRSRFVTAVLSGRKPSIAANQDELSPCSWRP